MQTDEPTYSAPPADAPPAPEPVAPPAEAPPPVPVRLRLEDMRPRYADGSETTIFAVFEMSSGEARGASFTAGDGSPYAPIFDDWMSQSSLNRAEHYRAYQSLEAFRDAKKRQVDQEAERARLKYVTAGSTQTGVYVLKEQEAMAYVADSDPDPSLYPLLQASVGTSDGETLDQVAQTILNMAAMWRVIAAQIEGLRLKAKTEIDGANTVAQVSGVVGSILWP